MVLFLGELNLIRNRADCQENSSGCRRNIAYYELGTGDLEKARTVEELWSKTYPREFEAYDSLGWDSVGPGYSEAALGWARKALPLGVSNPLGYELLGAAYVNLNRLNEAHKIAQLESAAMTSGGGGDEMLASQAGTAAGYGKLTVAWELTQRASNFALHNDANYTAAKY